ncbi:MAG: 50S ribosomal protein L18 [Thaumarchaeota archaeon]|nr:50S ribosomal protein L18 [Nitrososphaerota archaeon]
MPKSHYVHIFRRRREGKTDYRKRKGIIMGKLPFVSIRISGKYIYSQIMKPTATGDLTLAAASSRDLVKKFGWKGSTKNLPGAYLTGFYLGQLAGKGSVKNAIVYSGVGRFVHGSRIASLVNGARDAGLNIQVNDESLPEDYRIQGKHIADYAKKLEAEDKEKFNQVFSKILSLGLNPSDYPSHFESVKASIENETSS